MTSSATTLAMASSEDSTKKNKPWLISSSSMVPTMAIASSIPFVALLAYHTVKFVLFDLFPTVWNFYSPLFTPFNLFFLMNFIIFALFAMSHAQQHQNEKTTASPAVLLSPSPSPPVWRQESSFSDSSSLRHLESVEENHLVMEGGDGHHHDRDSQQEVYRQDSSYKGLETEEASQNDEKPDLLQQEQIGAGYRRIHGEESPSDLTRDGDVDPNPLSTTLSESSSQILAALAMSELKERMEKPLPSVRFANRTKGVAMASGEHGRSGSPLRISRPSMKRGETMEATWRAICEKKERTTNMQQKQKHSPSGMKMKSRLRRESSGAEAMAMAALSPNKAVKMKREPSMRADELHARIEAFISRFHEQIRIQRQQSLLDSYADRSGEAGGGAA